MPTELSQGFLRVFVIERTGLAPIENASVTIVYEEAPEAEPREFTTDNSGQTPIITLPAPPLAYSEAPDEPKPYSEYTITVTKEGYEETIVTGSEILPDELSVQVVQLRRLEQPEEALVMINIPDHTLYGIYPPKIPEPEIKPLPETGEIVLSRVVIPEYIIVHDGIPSDASAPNYWVRYTDYIKNVASCEIYATWEEASILANILVIMSFTLNRVFTEFYRNQGYDFTITSSTAYDQKFIYGRNIFENISNLVDQVFNNYLARPGITQPIFTSYCDGQRVTCNGLSQWGSKFLGDEGYSAIEIIRNYYGQDMYIATAEQISGVPSSFPGYDLTIGASGDKVRQLQRQLNRIAQDYPAIPTLNVDGIYGPRTAESVRIFQRIFGLPQTGVTDFATWYAISRIYVGVARLSEPGAY
ncbi:MAG: peptidoglycan-binding protein [Lachnospiraceae bacterium]|nr:peptidoglycan-binding protein [Lachnospiraceae bacterium]